MLEDSVDEAGKFEFVGLKALKIAVDKLESRRIEDFVDGVDWVTKLALLVNYEPQTYSEGISVCNQYALLDGSVMNYTGKGKGGKKNNSLYNPKDSIAFAEAELPEVDWGSLTERVNYALNNAPEDTRNFFTAEMLKRYGSEVKGVSWSTLVLKEAKVMLDEPFMLNKEEIGAEMAEAGGSGSRILAVVKELYPNKVIY
jgi:hypothetical protein